MIHPQGEIGLWEINETLSFFQRELLLSVEEELAIEEMFERRKKEWMAGRLLLHKMSGRTERGIPIKDEFGKPHLPQSPYDISLSHSGRFAAAIASPYVVGIDIQKIVQKLKRIENKFMTPTDLASLSEEHYLEHLHVCWGAKEAMYKAYGKKKLEFKEHIIIHPFTFDVSFGQFQGYIKKENVHMTFNLYYKVIENYILVYAVKTN